MLLRFLLLWNNQQRESKALCAGRLVFDGGIKKWEKNIQSDVLLNIASLLTKRKQYFSDSKHSQYQSSTQFGKKSVKISETDVIQWNDSPPVYNNIRQI